MSVGGETERHEHVEATYTCPHEWVAPVTRDPDTGALLLTHPDQPSLTAVEHMRLLRGHLIERMVFCRHCGAKPEGGGNDKTE